MTTPVATPITKRVDVAGLTIQSLENGDGKPILVLHHSTGNPGWIRFYDELARRARVVVPDMPGYGQSTRPEWAREPRDIAILLHQYCDAAGLDDIAVIGLGFGGFVAAEMAALNSRRLTHLVLVGAPGLQPTQGAIMDQMMMDFHEYVAAGFANEGDLTAYFGDEKGTAFRELWDFSREMTARISWKPYMFSRRLAPLLAEVRTPALLLWGKSDVVVPARIAEQYRDALGNAKLEWIDGGHLLEYENPASLADRIAQFVG